MANAFIPLAHISFALFPLAEKISKRNKQIITIAGRNFSSISLPLIATDNCIFVSITSAIKDSLMFLPFHEDFKYHYIQNRAR